MPVQVSKVVRYNLLLVRRGELKYPDYKISRNSAVFRSRDDFSNSEYYRNDLPRFLQTFSLPHRAVRLIRLGVGICERLRRYREAVALVLIPLSSPCLLSSATSRSVCFFIQRLILDQGNHCRDTVSCAKTVVGLFPTMCGLHPGHRLELQRQIGRALEKKNCWGQSQLADANEIPSKSKRARKGGSQRVEEGADATLIKEFEEICTKLLPPLKSAPLVKLSAPVVGSSADLGAHRPMYVWTEPVGSAGDASTASSLLHVEEWVLKHYIHNMGFEKGFHCESRAYTSLFGLLFYDLLYTVDRRDAFYSMRQVAPLDLLTGEFYASQKDAIEARLEMISSAKDNSHHHSLSNSPEGDVGPLDPVSKLLTMVWTEHKDERCIGVNWDLFPGGERDIFDLFWCLGPKLVASICRLLVKDYRNWSSGLPDLCVWSPSVGKAKVR
ncbi:unnamed protein product [Mesocestoides corti]|uniref:Fanconi-associated nuclease n=1 Tax=Mesocestoides corti TaxID=53468 RepID=A0A0R3UE86_MESCO|nr:unnamed protein product [Mesocestoides corti]